MSFKTSTAFRKPDQKENNEINALSKIETKGATGTSTIKATDQRKKLVFIVLL